MIKFLKVELWDQDKKETVIKEIPIRASYIALKRMKETFGRVLSPVDDGTDYAAYEALLLQAMKLGYRMLGEEMPYTEKDIEAIMDGAYKQFMTIVPEFFSDANLDGAMKMEEPAGKKSKRN